MNRIKELRLLNNLKQIELCKELGITQGALSGWENGKYEPDLKSLTKLAELFKVSIDYLLGNTDEKTQKETPSDEKVTLPSDDDIKFALFNGDKEITDEMYEEVKSFAQFIRNRKNTDKR